MSLKKLLRSGRSGSGRLQPDSSIGRSHLFQLKLIGFFIVIFSPYQQLSTRDADDSVTLLGYFHVVICLRCFLHDMMGICLHFVVYFGL